MGIKRDSADAAFSDCVRERADWKCENDLCGRQFSESDRGSLQCAHIYGRRAKSIRQDPLNAFAFCFGCHQHFTENPLDFELFVKRKLGEGALNILNEKRQGLVKYNKLFIKDCAAHYREQFKTMREKRKQGATGYLNFEGYI